MKARHHRFILVAAGLALLGLSAWLVLRAFEKNMVFFFTPTQVLAGEAPRQRSFRVGGMVESGSLQRQPDGITVKFVVTDTVQRVPVSYRGMLPDLFKEGKGVVAQGTLGAESVFVAEEVLAKHDENYMPPEAAYAMEQAKALKAAGRPGGAAPTATAVPAPMPTLMPASASSPVPATTATAMSTATPAPGASAPAKDKP
jgi:cytochrome c-type biogenesis protein CcmE